MRKIPTLFVRDPDDRKHVLPEVTPGCEWVLAGEGVPTRKYDGTCVRLDENGQWWARREVKPGKTAPNGWEQVDRDYVTGKSVGWEPIEQSGFYEYAREAMYGDNNSHVTCHPGTYELVGPKVNGNPEQFAVHAFVCHEHLVPLWSDEVVTFDRLRGYLTDPGFVYEGIVWHHPDGRMAKLKRRDFG